MPSLLIGVLAYTLSGFSLVIDKSLIRNSVKEPLVMAFYIGMFNCLVIGMIPFGFISPSAETWILFVSSGLLFGIAVVAFLESLKYFDLLVAAPIVGILNPVTTLAIDTLVLGRSFSPAVLLSLLLLLGGAAILTANLWFGKHALNKNLILLLISGVLFGFSYETVSLGFQQTNFVTGLVISRLSFVALVLGFLFFSKFRYKLGTSAFVKNHFENDSVLLLICSQAMSAVSGLMIFWAVFLSHPAIVNSLFSAQFVVLFIIALVLARKYPQVLHENLRHRVLVLKVLGLVVITTGLAILVKS